MLYKGDIVSLYPIIVEIVFLLPLDTNIEPILITLKMNII